METPPDALNIEALVPQVATDYDAEIQDGIQKFEQLLADSFDAQHAEIFYEHADYVDSLFDEFAPHIEPDLRMRAKILGGISLTFMSIKYGHDATSPKLYGGLREERVLAAYHHAQHPRHMMRAMFEYATKINEVRPGTYSDEDFVTFPETAGFHDVCMGDGRRVDEVQSWLLYKAFLERLGFAPSNKTKAGILVTIWDDLHKRQLVDTSEKALTDDPEIWDKRVAGVGDLASVFECRGPYEALCVWLEDNCKKQNKQLFTKEADAAGFSLHDVSVEDCFAFVDTRERLLKALGKALAGNVVFMRSFQPADPDLDQYFTGRLANVTFFEAVSARFDAGKLSARGVFRAARMFRDGFLPPAA